MHTRGSPPPACSFEGQVSTTPTHHSGSVGPRIRVCDCVWAQLVSAVSLLLSFRVCICVVQCLSVKIGMCPDDLRVWKRVDESREGTVMVTYKRLNNYVIN